MKIGILTQPLHQNYGGLLQAYALQLTLKRMGYNPVIVDRHHSIVPEWRKIASHIKTVAYKLFGKKREFIYWPTRSEYETIAQHTNYFIDKYIQPKSKRLHSRKEFNNYIQSQKFDVFIVGSDQVWRPCYSPHLPTYFLDFLKENKEVRKIAYAASFGVDNWEYTDEQTLMAKQLAPLFDVISVREDSGVELCRRYLGVKAEHVLDPTMLLNKQDYLDLILAEKEPLSPGNLFTYILDPSEEKQATIEQIAQEKELIPFSVQAKLNTRTRKNCKERIEDLVVPPVTKWLRGFYDAEFVITDSFHGCVFSIIFNKPFIAIGNQERGIARFNSLLSLYGLKKQLNSSSVKNISPAEWTKINELKFEMEKSSLNFLKENLHDKE